ncbi:transmembrane amino acid transporter protein-domain-containing protein [Aspergillus desertorum]
MSSEPKLKQEPDPALAQVTSTLGTGEVRLHPATAHEDVFGEISADAPNYCDVGWLGTVALMSVTGLDLYASHCNHHYVTIAVGIQDRPSEAPRTPGPWISDYKLVGKPSFTEAITAVSSLIFAYCGTSAFFAIVSEMRDPRYYTRSLIICQSGVTAIYITIGTVVHYYCGSYVASPALGSVGSTVKKVAYGFALPGLIVTTMLVIHVSFLLIGPVLYLFIHLTGQNHLHPPPPRLAPLNSNTPTHWITWLSCTFGITVIAYIIASAIPVFNGLVRLVGALLGTLMSFQPMGCMWLYDNWTSGKSDKKAKWVLMVCWCVFVVAIGTFCMVAGTYGSVVGVVDSYRETGGSGAWS